MRHELAVCLVGGGVSPCDQHGSEVKHEMVVRLVRGEVSPGANTQFLKAIRSEAGLGARGVVWPALAWRPCLAGPRNVSMAGLRPVWLGSLGGLSGGCPGAMKELPGDRSNVLSTGAMSTGAVFYRQEQS